MADYPQAQNQGGQPPAFRRGLLQALLGLGTGGTDQDPENRIEGDPATRANQDLTPVGQSASQRPAAGSTSDLENRVAAGRPSLSDQMSAPTETPVPDHLQDLQSQYDRLNPTPQPVSTKGKLLRGLMGAATGFLGGRTTLDKVQQQRDFEQNQNREKSQNLLSQIEAERRMREQEGLATQRMTLQEQMERDREEAAAGRLQPEHMDTDQGPLQYNRQTRQWEPIMVGGQRVGPKAQPKPDSEFQQFADSPEEQGKTFTQKVEDYAKATQKPEQPQRPQQVLGVGPDNRVVEIRPGMTLPEGTRTLTGDMAAGAKAEATTSKRYETAMDADQRLGRMEAAYGKAVKGDQQAMLSLLADHIGMTLGMQKGARITKDILNEAQQSQPWLAKIGAKFDDRGYLSGVTLGPDQMRQMLDLGYEARDRAVQGAYDDSQLYGVEPPKGAAAVFGKRQMGAKPALQGGGQGGQINYQPGLIRNGYRFKGGDPTKQENWEAVPKVRP